MTFYILLVNKVHNCILFVRFHSPGIRYQITIYTNLVNCFTKSISPSTTKSLKKIYYTKLFPSMTSLIGDFPNQLFPCEQVPNPA